MLTHSLLELLLGLGDFIGSFLANLLVWFLLVSLVRAKNGQ